MWVHQLVVDIYVNHDNNINDCNFFLYNLLKCESTFFNFFDIDLFLYCNINKK